MSQGATGRLTSRGRVTIPKLVRERLGLQPGDEVEFLEAPDGIRIRRRPPENPFEQWRGYLQHLKGPDVVELMRDWHSE